VVFEPRISKLEFPTSTSGMFLVCIRILKFCGWLKRRAFAVKVDMEKFNRTIKLKENNEACQPGLTNLEPLDHQKDFSQTLLVEI